MALQTIPDEAPVVSYNHQGSSVLLPVHARDNPRVRIMALGGRGEGNRATNTAQIFDFSPDTPESSSWRDPTGGHMRYERFMSDAVLLADGTVLVVNGAGRGAADSSHDPVLTAELFDPDDETWTPAAVQHRRRMYHSSACLLQDGTVLICGNTRSLNPSNPIEDSTIEIFSPPYMFKGSRPSIQAMAKTLQYNSETAIGTQQSSEISRVALIRISSSTHSNNMDQRYVELPIVSRTAEELFVLTPTDGSIAPPGFYNAFVLNDNRVPSVGRTVRIA